MLPIFPSSALDNSILTSVLVGLLVVWVFTETLGWNFTGLVVPGYLASIFVIDPITGAVVSLEAVFTWAVVAVTSDKVPRWWPWNPIFGRDRFLLFLLVSVAVRIALEGGGFALLSDTLGVTLDEELHSMGLVVVPLAANSLWRSGPGALHRLAVPVLLTWAILVGLLLPFTNLSLSRFELTYEDLALNFVASPRAYILLLVGAALGSAANHRWGWDFGGIIVPGLLALCWLQPHRIVATFAEALLLALLLTMTLKLPWLRTANLTGGRPMVLAYTLGYLLKFGAAWVLGGRLAGFEVGDAFGYGYLLSAILALRIVKYRDPLRAVVPALGTSLVAFVVASALGYGLAVALPPSSAPGVTPPPAKQEDALFAVLRAAWEDAGPSPTGVALVAASREPAFVVGGDGFGGLLVRGEGREFVVTGAVGAPLAGPAVLAVAKALDARVVLLCADEDATACKAARADLAGTFPVLRVAPGSTARLAAAGRLDPAIDLGELGALVGAFQTESTASRGGFDTLHLDAAARARAAARALGAVPAPVDEPTWLPRVEDAKTPLPDPGAVRLFRNEILAPWLAWREAAPWGEDGLVAVAGLARGLGLGIARDEGLSRLDGPGFAVWIDRAGGRRVIEVPDGREQPGALLLGRALLRSLEAGTLILSAPDGWTHQADERGSYTHTALLAALEGAGSTATLLTVRKVPAIFDPGADLVLSLGRPALTGGPPLAEELRTRLETAGFRVARYDGTAQRIPMLDPANAGRAAAFAAAGDEAQVTVWMTDAVERRLAPVAANHPLHEGLQIAALPVQTFDVRTLAPYLLPELPGDTWAGAVSARDRFVRTGRAAALGQLPAGTARVCDPFLGCRWLLAERCEGETCDGVLLPLVVRADASTPGPSPDALALGGWDVAFRRPRSAR